jgi:hypothetical protein
MFTDDTVVERITRRIMREREAWSIEEALAYQPAKVLKKEPVTRAGRVVAWVVTYRYLFKNNEIRFEKEE